MAVMFEEALWRNHIIGDWNKGTVHFRAPGPASRSIQVVCRNGVDIQVAPTAAQAGLLADFDIAQAVEDANLL